MIYYCCRRDCLITTILEISGGIGIFSKNASKTHNKDVQNVDSENINKCLKLFSFSDSGRSA